MPDDKEPAQAQSEDEEEEEQQVIDDAISDNYSNYDESKFK